MKILLKLFFVILLAFNAFAFPSPELSKLWEIPLDSLKITTLKNYSVGNINVEEIYYQSRQYKGNSVKIFGYFCYPKNQSNLPAVLVCHGGGGSAKLPDTLYWANNGYAVLSVDLPGKGQQRSLSRSTGPNMTVPNLLRTSPDLTDNYLVHAVAAVRNGITFLSQRKQVDPQNIGMIGLSWGGVITLLTNGQEKRLKTAVNVFGSGYIYESSTWQRRFDAKTKAELLAWDTFIDPNSFLKSQQAPILFITGTNDHCYYLPTFQKTFCETTQEKQLLLIPNLKHKFPADIRSIAKNWMDAKLRSAGVFPQIQNLPIYTKGNEKIIVPVTATPTDKIKEVKLYYAQGVSRGWTIKQWQSLEPYYQDGTYSFTVPRELIKPEIVFFVNAKDINGSVVSTPVRSLFNIVMPENPNTFAVSAPLRQIDALEGPIQFFGNAVTPDLSKVYFSEADKTYQIFTLN